MNNSEEKDDKWSLDKDEYDTWCPRFPDTFDFSSDDANGSGDSFEIAEREVHVAEHINEENLCTNPPAEEIEMRENVLQGHGSTDIKTFTEATDSKHSPSVKTTQIQGCEESLPMGNNLKIIDHSQESDSTDGDRHDFGSSDQTRKRIRTCTNLKAIFWLTLVLLFFTTAVIPTVAEFISIVTSFTGYVHEQRVRLGAANLNMIFRNNLDFLATLLKYNNRPPSFLKVNSVILLFCLIPILTNAHNFLAKAKIEIYCSLGNQLKELNLCIDCGGINKKSALATGWMFKFRFHSNIEDITVLPVHQPPPITPIQEEEAEEYSDPVSSESDGNVEMQFPLYLSPNSLEETEQDYYDATYEPTVSAGTDIGNQVPDTVEVSESTEALPRPDSGYHTTERCNVSLQLSKIERCVAFSYPQNPGCLLLPTYELEKVPDVITLNGDIDSFLEFIGTNRKGGFIIDKTMLRDVEYGNFECNEQYTILGKSQRNFVCKTKNGLEFIMRKVPRCLFNVDQIESYVQPGIHQDYVPKLLGVFVDEQDVSIFLSHRKGVTLEEVLARPVWNIMEKLMFITYLLQGVQALHKQGIALLGVNLSSIEMEDVRNLSSLRFANIQFSHNTITLDENFPMYSPPERINTPTRSSCMRYDMWGVGVLVFRIIQEKDLWAKESLMIKRIFHDDSITSKAICEQIKMKARQVHAKVMSINQRAHPCLPGLIHLLLCLLNPNGSRRAESRNIHQHGLFLSGGSPREGNGRALMERLETISTRGHGCGHCVISVVDAENILYVTAVPRGSTLRSLLNNTSIPILSEGDYTLVFQEDMALQICH